MELRGYREGDLGALSRLGVAAFGGSVSDWEGHFLPEKNPRHDPERVHVIEDDGEVRASVTVLPLESFVDGEPRPMGGVAAVMAHPAYRRRGYAGELMRAALRDMRERGEALSLLAPFAHAFYRSFGYELATEAIEYTLSPTDLPTSPEQASLRAYREGDLPAMMALLEAEAVEHQLCVRRSEAYWRHTIARKDFEAAVYEGKGGVEGYLLYKMSGYEEEREPARRLQVEELIAGTPKAREALLSFLGALDPDTFRIRHWTTPGEPLHPYLPSAYVKARIEPDQMLRLVDVEAALGFLDRAADQPLVLEVADDVIPENGGPYTVGGKEVVRGAEAAETVALDVRRLAQLYAGYLPARGLARRELVRPGSPKALELLEALFPAGDPCLFAPDHF
jgi:predicted acetyltransferase